MKTGKLQVPAEVVVACVGGIIIERGETPEDALRIAEAIVRGERRALGDLELLREVSSVLLTLNAHDMLKRGASKGS